MKIELYKHNFSSCQTTTLGGIPRTATFRVKDDAGHGMAKGTRIARADVAGWLRKGVALYVDTPESPCGPFDSIRIAE